MSNTDLPLHCELGGEILGGERMIEKWGQKQGLSRVAGDYTVGGKSCEGLEIFCSMLSG